MVVAPPARRQCALGERERDTVNASATPLDAPERGRRGRAVAIVLATLAGIALATRLGFWQLDRAHQKIALQAGIEARAHEPALDVIALARTPAAAAAQQHRPVVVRGRWLADRTVFLDNRQMDGKVGFYVVTPLALDPARGAILVQRGWAPRNFSDRTALPSVQTPTGLVTVEGIVAASPARLFEFAGAASGAIRQNLDIASFARETGLDLLPISVVQRDARNDTADGLVRHWPAPASDVQKHYGYAVQWFAIAAGIAVLYVWHRFIRPGKP
jgi:surfeit locus 1 family protein